MFLKEETGGRDGENTAGNMEAAAHFAFNLQETIYV